MNNVYPAAVDAIITGQIDVTTDLLHLVMLDTSLGTAPAYDPADVYLDDIDAAILVPGEALVTVDHVTGGVVYPDPITFPAATAGYTVSAIVVYKLVTGLADSPLLAFIDSRADTTPLLVETNDGDLLFNFQRGLFKL